MSGRHHLDPVHAHPPHRLYTCRCIGGETHLRACNRSPHARLHGDRCPLPACHQQACRETPRCETPSSRLDARSRITGSDKEGMSTAAACGGLQPRRRRTRCAESHTSNGHTNVSLSNDDELTRLDIALHRMPPACDSLERHRRPPRLGIRDTRRPLPRGCGEEARGRIAHENHHTYPRTHCLLDGVGRINRIHQDVTCTVAAGGSLEFDCGGPHRAQPPARHYRCHPSTQRANGFEGRLHSTPGMHAAHTRLDAGGKCIMTNLRQDATRPAVDETALEASCRALVGRRHGQPGV